MKRSILAFIVMTFSPPAVSQIVGEPIIASGTCDQKSGVMVDDGETSQFSCDTVVITRSQRGTILIQFTDKHGDDGRILGFAGTIEGKQGFGADAAQILGVERVYLGAGDPVIASAGSCIMNWSGLQRTGGRLESVVCGGRGKAEGSDFKALVILEAR